VAILDHFRHSAQSVNAILDTEIAERRRIYYIAPWGTKRPQVLASSLLVACRQAAKLFLPVKCLTGL
jgi:hypothetical protein